MDQIQNGSRILFNQFMMKSVKTKGKNKNLPKSKRNLFGTWRSQKHAARGLFYVITLCSDTLADRLCDWRVDD
jgi:hypothetical protein